MRSLKVIVSIIVLLVTLSCNKKFFVDKSRVIGKTEGMVVFMDRASREYENRNGDVFVDSLIPDLFIPYNFPNKVITKDDIVTAFLSRSQQQVSFFYLIRDCDNEERNSSVERECITLFLDKNIDDYLHSNKIYVQPVTIEFLQNNIDREYLQLHRKLSISYKGHSKTLIFNKGSYDVLSKSELEFNWNVVSESDTLQR